MSSAMTDRPTCFSIELGASVLAPAAARAQLEPWRSLPTTERYSDLRLIISELVLNSAVHGPSGGRIQVRLEATGASFRGEVIDHGHGFVPPPPPAVTRDGGNGLVIVDAIADRWGVAQDRPTTVWFELDHEAQPP
jgi:anti-sigma regulatory factor (Ser/Thr protein kinase)